VPGPHRLFAVYTEGGYPDGSAGIFAGDTPLYTERKQAESFGIELGNGLCAWIVPREATKKPHGDGST
jgi:hypothetical protein